MTNHIRATYKSSPLQAADGQDADVLIDGYGRLQVVVVSGGGGGSGTTGQQTMANSAPVVIASNQSAIPVTGTFFQATQPISGSVSVSNFPSTQAISGSISLSSALPAGTNVIGHVITDTGSTVSVSNFPATQPVSGSVSVSNFPATQPVSGTVTANAGTGTFTVSGTVTSNIGTTGGLALDTSIAKLTITQSTALGTNTLAMVGGSVTTAAPTYVTGNINPLSLTVAGALRVDGSAVSQTVVGNVAAGSAVSGNPVQVAGSDGTSVRRILTTATGLTRTTYDYGSVPGSQWLSTAYASFAAAGVAVKSSAGILRYFQFINNSGSAGNIQMFNGTTQPSAGAVPLISTPIASAAAATFSTFEGGFPFSTGIYIVMSSTLATYTAIASTAFTGVAVYA